MSKASHRVGNDMAHTALTLLMMSLAIPVAAQDKPELPIEKQSHTWICLLYTSDAADE